MYSVKKKTAVAILGIVAVFLLIALYFYPADKYSFWPKCPLYYYTGIYCPGCGNTRALSALLHGNLLDSLRKNILFIPAVITLILLLVRPRLAYNRFFAWGITIVVILFFILRNLPWYPFSLLAPH